MAVAGYIIEHNATVRQAAKQFGLTVSLLTSKSGCAVLRFKDGTEVYEDDVFLEKSELFITHMLETYGSQLPGDSVLPEEEQEESGEEDPEATTTEVYLVFAGEAVSQATLGHLEALEYVLGADVYCTFFLTEMQIRNDSQLVRDIYNNGHMIGLTVSAGETNVSDALQRANDALDSVLLYRSLMALLPVEPAEQLQLRVYGPSQTVDTVEAALEYTEYPPLLVCRSDVASMLEQLSLHNVSILQLLETDIPIKRMQEEG